MNTCIEEIDARRQGAFDKRIGRGLIDAGDQLEPAFPVAEGHRPETQFRNDKSGS